MLSKYLVSIYLLTFSILLTSGLLFGYGMSSGGGAGTSGGLQPITPGVPGTSSTTPSKTPAAPPATTTIPKKPGVKEGEKIVSSVYEIFTVPGVVALRGDAWVGTENLYNLTPDLGLFVEFIESPNLNLPLRENTIKEKVSAIVRDSGISVRGNVLLKKTPLPFLHCILMIMPIEKGFTAYCAIRLFEETRVSRVFLPTEVVWQTITWEKQEIIVSATEQITEQVTKTFEDLATSFVQRYRQEREGRSNLPSAQTSSPQAQPTHVPTPQVRPIH